MFICADNETSFNNDFKNQFVSQSITIEKNVSYISIQNAYLKRKNKMLIAKTKTYKIKIEFPRYL